MGQKVLLKGEKCVSPKCPAIRRPYAPGPKKRRRRRTFSEYGKELAEKQKLKNYYGLRERQFRKYIKDVLLKRGGAEDATSLLVKRLEKRFDNVVFRLGFAKSRREASQLVSHGHFLVNGKSINTPAFEIKKKTIIAVKDNKRQKAAFKNLSLSLKNYQAPEWLRLDKENLKGEMVAEPKAQDLATTVDIPAIFEFYSR